MNVEFIEKLIAHFEGLPEEAIDMDTYLQNIDHPCKTVGCIAGYACVLGGLPEDWQKHFHPAAFKHLAQEYMGLEAQPGYAFYHGLFYVNEWPADLRRQYWSLGPHKRDAVVARLKRLLTDNQQVTTAV